MYEDGATPNTTHILLLLSKNAAPLNHTILMSFSVLLPQPFFPALRTQGSLSRLSVAISELFPFLPNFLRRILSIANIKIFAAWASWLSLFSLYSLFRLSSPWTVGLAALNPFFPLTRHFCLCNQTF